MPTCCLVWYLLFLINTLHVQNSNNPKEASFDRMHILLGIFPPIEILNLSFWQPTSEEFLIILEQVFRKLRNLKYLDLSFCQLDNPQISKILKLRIPTLQFKMISNYYEGQIGDSGPALSVAMSDLLNDHGYYSSNVSIQQDQWDMALRFRAILHWSIIIVRRAQLSAFIIKFNPLSLL